jgi:hypothetical protein
MLIQLRNLDERIHISHNPCRLFQNPTDLVCRYINQRIRLPYLFALGVAFVRCSM